MGAIIEAILELISCILDLGYAIGRHKEDKKERKKRNG